MISHGKAEIGYSQIRMILAVMASVVIRCRFMLCCLFYIMTIYLHFKWPVPVDISTDLLTRIKTLRTFDSMLDLIRVQAPRRL